MEGGPLDPGGGDSVSRIPDDGQADRSEVNTDLISSTSFEVCFDERVVSFDLQHLPSRDGVLSHLSLASEPHLQRARVLDHGQPADSFVEVCSSLRDGDILSFEFSSLELLFEPLSCFRCSGDRQNPTGETIEPLDDEESRPFLPVLPQFPGDFTKQADFVLIFIGRDGEQACGFVNHQEMAILMQDFHLLLESFAQGGADFHRFRIYRQAIADPGPETRIEDDFPCDLNASPQDDFTSSSVGEFQARLDFRLQCPFFGNLPVPYITVQ